MGVAHIFKILQIVLNHVKHLILCVKIKDLVPYLPHRRRNKLLIRGFTSKQIYKVGGDRFTKTGFKYRYKRRDGFVDDP